MKRVAIIGGGISGLTAAYELEQQRKAGADLEWELFEAGDRLGGIIETTRRDGFVLEGGPDAWVSEKPWARELCVELGLESELIYSNDDTRKTYVLVDGKLMAMPDGMRMMVPEDLSALEGSPLFSNEARAAYAAEVTRAEDLRASAPDSDESVASFVRRHFGDEVLAKIGAPLLSGVFGGDVETLSVRAVMPQFVAMEREYGSLIKALEAKKVERGGKPQQPIFTSLRGGMQALVEAVIANLPSERVHLNTTAYEIELDVEEWYVDVMAPEERTFLRRLTKVIPYWDVLILATNLDMARKLLHEFDPHGTALIRSDNSFLALAPKEASSSVLVAMAWTSDQGDKFDIPSGFGFLVPQGTRGVHLLAGTFVDQKFPERVPEGGRILRAFFGGASADALENENDEAIAATALLELRGILGPMPEPDFYTVRRLPRSLPQYEVGHLERMQRLDELVAEVPGLHLLGNSYRGVGIPDLIRDARATARAICAST